MSINRNLEERAAAFVANFEEKVDSLVSREKASFKQFCQSEFNKLKGNTSSSFEDSGVPDFDSSSVVNSTVIPQPPDLQPRPQVYPIQIYVPPPPLLARLAKIDTPTVSTPRPVIVPVRRSGRKFRETNKFTYSPSHIKVQKSRKRRRTMSLERVRCNLDEEFEAEEVVDLSLEAANDDLLQTPTSPRSPIPVAIVRPRMASPFPVGHGEPDLLDFMEPIDPFDVPAAPTATPVPLDEVSLYGEVEADSEAANLDEDRDYVGLEQTAQLYDELGLGMEQLSENDEEVERINALLDDERPLSSLSEININLDSPSTDVTSVTTSCASLSEVDLTCNEDYDPNFGVRFEDGVAMGSPTSDNDNDGPNNNDNSNMTADSASMMATPPSVSDPPPYQPRGAYRCHQCGALNNIAATTSSWISPPPPYEALPEPQPQPQPQPVTQTQIQIQVVEGAAAAPVGDGVDGPPGEDDLFYGGDQVVNVVGMQPDGQDYTAARPPIGDDYGQREMVPLRDLIGPADDEEEEK